MSHVSPSSYAELRTEHIGRSVGAQLPDAFQVVNGLVRTPSGVLIGCAHIAGRSPDTFTTSEESLQDALLGPGCGIEVEAMGEHRRQARLQREFDLCTRIMVGLVVVLVVGAFFI